MGAVGWRPEPSHEESEAMKGTGAVLVCAGRGLLLSNKSTEVPSHTSPAVHHHSKAPQPLQGAESSKLASYLGSLTFQNLRINLSSESLGLIPFPELLS